jgi:general secretion pathway protein L
VLFQNTIGIDIRRNRVNILALKTSFRGEKKVFHTSVSFDGELSSEKKVKLIGGIVRQFIVDNSLGEPELFMAIPRDRVVVREVRLPSAVRENLRATLGYEMQKYVPLPVDEIYFDYVLCNDNGSDDTVRLLLLVVKKDDLDDYLALASYVGLALSGIQIQSTALTGVFQMHDVDGAGGRFGIIRTRTTEAEISIYRKGRIEQTQIVASPDADGLANLVESAMEKPDPIDGKAKVGTTWLYWHESGDESLYDRLNKSLERPLRHLTGRSTPVESVDLLGAYGLALQNSVNPSLSVNLVPPSLRRKPSRAGVYTLVTLLILTVLMAIAGLSSILIQQRMKSTAIDNELSRLASQVSVVDRISTKIETVEKEIERIDVLKEKRVSALQVLEELSRRIPLDSWIQGLRLKADGVRIQGISDSASELLPILEESPLFKDAVFVSAITKTKEGKERFHIGLTFQ